MGIHIACCLMTAESLIACYRILDLPAGADAEALRRQYRKLAQRLHPDRHADTAQSFQQVQQAYATLRQFHREHGYLPLQRDATEKPPLQPGQGVRRHAVAPRALWKKRRLHILVVVVAAAFFAWPEPDQEPDQEAESPPVSTAFPAGSAPPVDTGDHASLTTGLSLAEVVTILGVPHARDSDVWHYGASRVYFHQGKVSGWHEDPSFPLHLAAGQPITLGPATAAR